MIKGLVPKGNSFELFACISRTVVLGLGHDPLDIHVLLVGGVGVDRFLSGWDTGGLLLHWVAGGGAPGHASGRSDETPRGLFWSEPPRVAFLHRASGGVSVGFDCLQSGRGDRSPQGRYLLQV